MAKNKPIPQEPFRKTIIHLETRPDGGIASEVQNITFEKLLRITVPFIVTKAKDVLVAASKDPKMTERNLADLKLMMYDTLNIAFSNALDMFAPEIEARPDLTADAILKAQNELMEEEMKRRGFLKENGEINPDFKSDTPHTHKNQLPGQISVEEILAANKKSDKGGTNNG